MVKPITSRQVFFISAFDPRGARAYWSLYRKDSRKQMHRNNLRITLSAREKLTDIVSNWMLTAQKDVPIHDKAEKPAITETYYHYMHWDDIIRENWIREPKKLFLEGLKCNIHFGITSATFWRILKLDWKPAISGGMPFIFVALMVLLALFAFKIISGGGVVSFIFALIIAAGIIYAGTKIAKKLNLFWILRGHIFFSKYAKHGHEKFEKRIQEFADHIVTTVSRKPRDEVLVLTHCMGANVAVEVLHHIHENHPDFDLSQLKFVSLGQVIPWFSFLPQAKDFREKMSVLAGLKSLNWTDISAPPDTVCFALCDPFIGIKHEKKLTLTQRSPRFHTLFSPEEYKRIRRNSLRMHFQYLMSSSKSGTYDFFEMTAGEQPIEVLTDALKNKKTDGA